MPIPVSKSELIDAIALTYGKLKADLDLVASEQAKLKTMEGHAKGTQMSPADLVAYLIGWGELVLKWNHQIEAGEVATFPERGYKWAELGLLAQKFYKDYEDLAFAKLLDKLDETVSKILSLLSEKTNEEIYGVVWYKHYSMGRMVQLNTAAPYKNARTRIRKWLRENV